MTTKLQFNPSTLKVPFNPATQKVQMAVAEAICPYYCGLGAVIDVTFSGVAPCGCIYDPVNKWISTTWYIDINKTWRLDIQDPDTCIFSGADAFVTILVKHWQYAGCVTLVSQQYSTFSILVQKTSWTEIRVYAKSSGGVYLFDGYKTIEGGCAIANNVINTIICPNYIAIGDGQADVVDVT